MKTVCPGWSRPHIIAIVLADDGKPDGLTSYGMCEACQRSYDRAMNERELIRLRLGHESA